MPGQNAAWYRPYRLLFSPKEPAMYLAWGTKPTVAVPNVPVVFEVNLWNMRSEPVLENVTFNITTNGKKVTVTSPTGRYTHFANASDPSAAKYTFIVDLVSGPDTVNTRQLKAVVDVFGKLPWDVTPTAGGNIPALVRFGKAGTAIGPVDGIAALDEDWFASSIVGGESQIRPVAGHLNTVEPYTLPPVSDKWENVTQADGVFRVQVPCKSVQYYAVAVYSAAVQRIVLQYEFDTAAVMYFAGKRFVPREQGGSRRGSFAVDVMQGYHQVLVKLFSDNSTAKRSSKVHRRLELFNACGRHCGWLHSRRHARHSGGCLRNMEQQLYVLPSSFGRAKGRVSVRRTRRGLHQREYGHPEARRTHERQSLEGICLLWWPDSRFCRESSKGQGGCCVIRRHRPLQRLRGKGSCWLDLHYWRQNRFLY
ncbi:hypothetical protein C4B63_84g68 [Trypanosoma cruzi]|uniref:Uncharacterized protein n=1 Tax=Trypanosoma cruzi TaxID=5693 RepID=A0A2V2UUI8_TRYCR|nr:hypothetical protein C4B63_84g68 [Trypanosoma cruzi]